MRLQILLAARLPTQTIRLNCPVAELCDGGVRLVDGETVSAGAVVVATDASTAAIHTAAIDGTASVPLQVTYEHLLTGSEHHLASFIKELEAAGVAYEP